MNICQCRASYINAMHIELDAQTAPIRVLTPRAVNLTR